MVTGEKWITPNNNMGQLKKRRNPCPSPRLAKIQGMKNISKPRLPIEIYTFQEVMSTNDFNDFKKEDRE
jgi:hypothetical protein